MSFAIKSFFLFFLFSTIFVWANYPNSLSPTTNTTLDSKLNPTFINEDSNKDDVKKELSQKDKEKLTKNLKVGVDKRDTDNSKMLEVLGDTVENFDDYIAIRGHAVLKNKEGYILADEILYNPSIKQARIIGNVRIYRGDTLAIYTNQATIYFNSDFSIIRPFFVQESNSNIWTNSDSASRHKNTYRFRKSMVSGCSFVSPAWRIESTSGNYNQKSNMLSLWNPKIYIGDVPVFYFPYLRFSMENERTSGFLYPTLGNSSTDGFVYLQPYYLALQKFWDLTISPQVRSSRGYGINLEYRMVDPNNDKYILHLRYFYNNDDYMSRLNLLNQHIFGFSFKHSKRDVIQKYFGVKSKLDNGMYYDLAYMNDIDYMRLGDLRYLLNSPSYVSRANLYSQTNNNYFGLNIRYFLNLNTSDNSSTMQNLPNLQYHKYMSTFFLKELMYSFDYQARNLYRINGYRFISSEISLPIGFQFPVFQKYISLGFWLKAFAGNVYASNIDNAQIYKNANSPVAMNDNIGNYANLNYRISINSDIGKNYKHFFHSMQTSLVFSAPIDRMTFSNGNLAPEVINTYSKLPSNIVNDIQNDSNIWDPSNFPNVYQTATTINMNFSNYFYNRKGSEIFYWRISQTLLLENKDSVFRLPMENKLGTSPIPNLYVNVSFFYSWYFNSFTELALNFSYNNRFFSASLSYYLKREEASFILDPITLAFKGTDASNYLSAYIRGDIGYFGVLGNLSYDLRTNTVVNFGVGIYKDIKCFGVGIKVGSDRVPVLAQSNSITVINNIYVKAEFKFVPLTSFNYTYRLRPIVEEPQSR